MSKINVFPNTVIQTNGDTPYILKTIERTASLNEVFIESKTNDAINIDMQDIEFSGVSIKGGSEIGETTLTWVRTSKNTQPWTLVENRILTCTDELKEQYATELQFLISRGYNIDVPVSANYLRFTAREDSVNVKSGLPGVFEYKKNGEGDWFVWDRELTLQQDEYIDVRGYGFDNIGKEGSFKMTGNGNVEASGDITSLLNGTGGDVAITKVSQFASIFDSCSKLITPPNLPSTTLTNNCYGFMFYGCSRLTSTPELPATTLAERCYQYMFYKCSRLTTTSELPAIVLTTNCYADMFAYCSSLTTAPNLPATTLAEGCYYGMFADCSNLTTAPELPATILADECYIAMFYNCTSLTATPELPATTLATRCYFNMFYGCWSLEDISSLPATKLAEGCYASMFNTCSKLSITPELPATTLASSCYASMFSGSGITTAPELPATTLYHSCYSNMFYGCSWLRRAPELPATTLAPYCYNSMFFRCYNLTTAPELPATTLVDDCYDRMFYGCSKLNYVKIGAETPSPLYITNWLGNVAPTGTLEITNDILEVTLNDVSSCPPGWSVIGGKQPEPQPTVNLTLDLNNEWSRSNITNPDPTNYDMYMSASNWHKDRDNLTSSMYLVVQSNQDEYEFKFLVCADCEQYYDQVKAYEPGSETGVHANIPKWGDGAYLSNYTEVVYNPLQGNDTKRIKLSYVKAMFSSHLGNDRGFLLVPKGTPFINEYVE